MTTGTCLAIIYKTSRFAGFHTIRTRNKWNDAHYDRSKNGTIIDREETNELNRYFQSLDQICETKEIELRHIITLIQQIEMAAHFFS